MGFVELLRSSSSSSNGYGWIGAQQPSTSSPILAVCWLIVVVVVEARVRRRLLLSFGDVQARGGAAYRSANPSRWLRRRPTGMRPAGSDRTGSGFVAGARGAVVAEHGGRGAGGESKSPPSSSMAANMAPAPSAAAVAWGAALLLPRRRRRQPACPD
uniref:Uncharacterized protein n=1 Tax=Oryza sativa subsp. japonica TaxID=39947 RepID=Q8LNH5_ORYSJ|nr:hypothetical protein [Oryza sativa Japonica Group]